MFTALRCSCPGVLAAVCRLELPNDSFGRVPRWADRTSARNLVWTSARKCCNDLAHSKVHVGLHLSRPRNTTASTGRFSAVYGVGRHGSAVDGQRRRARLQTLVESQRKERVAAATDLSFLQISDSHIGFQQGSEQRCYGDIPKSRWTGSTPCRRHPLF